MNNKFIYIPVIVILIICLMLSSVMAYLYFKEKGINVDGTWISIGQVKASLLITDDDSNIIQFKDTSNPTFVLPRPMNVISRTSKYLEAVHNGAQGEIIKFVSKDGNTGVFSVQKSATDPGVSRVYQKT